MPTARIPLVGSFNQRGMTGSADLVLNEDQRFLNCVFNIVQNPVTGKTTVYVEKRPGWATDSVVEAGSASTGLLKPQSFDVSISAFGDTNSTIYFGTTSVGAITGRAIHFTETIISAGTVVMIKSSDGTGWYYVGGAKDTLTYTGDTHTNTTIDNLGSTAGMYSGQVIAGSGITTGTRISSVTSSTAIVTDTATTATASGVTITKTPIAKIISANFITTGTAISAFVEMDGYLFYSTDDGNLRNSDLNSVSAYTATSFVAPNMSPDPPVAVARHKNVVIVLGSSSKETFYNTGNATGSPLTRIAQYFERVGSLGQKSVTKIANDIYFVSSPKFGDVGVYRIRDLTCQKVSTPNVERIIGTALLAGGEIYASAFSVGGYPYAAFYLSNATDASSSSLLLESGDFLLLESATDQILLEGVAGSVSSYVRTLIYNAAINIWAEWNCQIATFIDGGSSQINNVIFATSRGNTSGKIYTVNPALNGDLYQDDGSAFTMEIRTSKIDHGTNRRKFITEIRLLCDNQSSGTVTLEANDSDYDPASWVTLGTFDLTASEARITRCGSYLQGRAYRLTHSANSAFRAEALEIDYEIAA